MSTLARDKSREGNSRYPSLRNTGIVHGKVLLCLTLGRLQPLYLLLGPTGTFRFTLVWRLPTHIHIHTLTPVPHRPLLVRLPFPCCRTESPRDPLSTFSRPMRYPTSSNKVYERMIFVLYLPVEHVYWVKTQIVFSRVPLRGILPSGSTRLK